MQECPNTFQKVGTLSLWGNSLNSPKSDPHRLSLDLFVSLHCSPLLVCLGHVGLVNQAMTCYLNSLLQTLYMTPEFRNAIYRLVSSCAFLIVDGWGHMLQLVYSLYSHCCWLAVVSQNYVLLLLLDCICCIHLCDRIDTIYLRD